MLSVETDILALMALECQMESMVSKSMSVKDRQERGTSGEVRGEARSGLYLTKMDLSDFWPGKSDRYTVLDNVAIELFLVPRPSSLIPTVVAINHLQGHRPYPVAPRFADHG